jgi:hypothetical protein
VIQKDRVYRKSAKGAEAIATRQHGLGLKLRSMLILVDGKRGFDELARLSVALGEPEQLLEHLLEQGFIEASSTKDKSAPPPPASVPVVESSATRLSLSEAQRFAVRRLMDILGPSSESLCLRIEAARNAHDYQAAVARAENIVREFRGTSAAREFAAEIEAHRPA